MVDPVKHRAEFYETVYEGCKKYGGSVVSGIRSTFRNSSVGGHPHSRHLDGTAFDIVCDTETKAAGLFAWFKAEGLHGYIRDTNTTALHIQADPPRKTQPPAET